MAKNRKAEVEAAQKGLDFNTKKYQLELDTSLGKITLDMLPDVAPGHVRNILGAGQDRLLRRTRLSSHHQGVHDSRGLS